MLNVQTGTIRNGTTERWQCTRTMTRCSYRPQSVAVDCHTMLFLNTDPGKFSFLLFKWHGVQFTNQMSIPETFWFSLSANKACMLLGFGLIKGWGSWRANTAELRGFKRACFGGLALGQQLLTQISGRFPLAGQWARQLMAFTFFFFTNCGFSRTCLPPVSLEFWYAWGRLCPHEYSLTEPWVRSL